MKKIKLFLRIPRAVALLCSLILVMSCTKDFDEINTNKNTVATIGLSELSYLFSRAQSKAPHSMWNYQTAQNLFADQYAQYFACEATSFGSDRLVINLNWAADAFNPMYTEVLPQLKAIFENSNPASAEYALASIWWVYTFHRVTDYWGPIPYFNAGVSGKSVAYDAQDKIYDDFFKRLSEAVTVLEDKKNEVPYGDFDLVYGGDVSKWIKFANTLRLRLAMRISNVDPVRAKAEAEAAAAGGVLTTSPGDDALVKRSVDGDDGNGLSIMQWNEFRMSASMESVLKGYNDPRMPEYFLPSVSTGSYEGLRNGLTSAQLTDASGLNSAVYNSQQGPRWSPSELGGTSEYLSISQNVMCTAEAYFLRAEGVLKGWNMGSGTAGEFYKAGITNSFLQWGIKADAAAYSSSSNVPIAPNDFLNSPAMTDIPVKFGSTLDVQIEQIATQKWIALYPDGMEAWADYRRNHKLKLYPVVKSDNDEITNTSAQWIRRLPFLTSERQNNTDAVIAAEGLLGGPDKITTPLWWDKN